MALERAYLAGVDMNMGDYDGRTALHLACVENHPACVKYLIETCKVKPTPIHVGEDADLHNRLTWMLKTDGETLLSKTLYGATIPGNNCPLLPDDNVYPPPESWPCSKSSDPCKGFL